VKVRLQVSAVFESFPEATKEEIRDAIQSCFEDRRWRKAAISITEHEAEVFVDPTEEVRVSIDEF
jgi:hypothetical protein